MKVIRNGLIVVAAACALTVTGAQAEDGGEVELGWSNSTDFSVVITEGNSNVETIGFSNTLRRRWEKARFQLKLDASRSDSSDDRFLLVEPGLTWLPGEPPTIGATSIVDPPTEPDFEKYFVEGKYERKFTDVFGWNAGGSWDRNEDAGILNRYIVFGGVGHQWKDTDDLRFWTTYGLSLTDREEETPDPLKEEQFAGIRVGWDYLNKFGKNTTYENDFTGNMSLADTADYTLDMTNAVSVEINKWLSLKVSLQWLYNCEPALEDVDVVIRAIVVDPDGIPGSGDEFFESVSSGGEEITLGEDRIRKRELDTVFRTSLVVTF